MKNMKNSYLLDETRLGILITNRKDGSPIGVPIWFDWDGETIRFFSTRTSEKIKRLARDAKASLLITNNIGEAEAWIAFDGEVTVRETGGIELAEKLAAKYWDLSNPEYAQRLLDWKSVGEIFALLEMVPTSIRSGG